MSIQEADSAYLCHFQLCFSIDRNRSKQTQTNIDCILYHVMYLRALANEMVPDTDSLLIKELPKGQPRRTMFCSLKRALVNEFSDSPNAMLVLDGYVMAVTYTISDVCS